jgi:hypothetical protein
MITEEDFVMIELNKGGGSYVQKETIEKIKEIARQKYSRLMIQREEHLDVRRHYELWGNATLKVIKKTPAPRAVLTVTIPRRMMDRLNGLKRGDKSAYVTRLLARGWLSLMEDLE